MKKKNFLPKDIHDLEDIFYNPNNVERKKKYESYTDSKIIDKLREKEAKKILEKFGISHKIPEENARKTPDYNINESKMVYEITSLQLSEEERDVTLVVKSRREEDFINDLNVRIEHALEKDYSDYPDYLKGVIIFVGVILAALTDYIRFSADSSLIKKTIFEKSNIDFMIMTQLPHSGNKKLAHVAYVKDDKLCQKFKENLPGNFNVIKV